MAVDAHNTPIDDSQSSGFDAAASRAKRPCPIWVDAFQRDTQELEADEVGAYFLILMSMWTRSSCDFPMDERKLARVSRVSTRLWRSRIGPSLMPFFTVENGAVKSKRLRKEAAYTERQVTQQHSRKFGKKHGKPLENIEEGKTADNPRTNPGEILPTTQLPTIVDTKVSTQRARGAPVRRFQEFWDIYPHRDGKKTDKQGAEKKYRAAVRSGVSEQTLIETAEAYRSDPQVLRGYGRGPVPWLNQRGWEDELSENPIRVNRDGPPRETYADEARRVLGGGPDAVPGDFLDQPNVYQIARAV